MTRRVLSNSKAGVLQAQGAEFLVELVDTTGSIYKLHLTSKERVRSVGDFQLNQWVFSTVFVSVVVTSLSTTFAQPGHVSVDVAEDYGAVSIGMKILFHCLYIFGAQR